MSDQKPSGQLLQAWISEELHERIRNAAEQEGISVSAWVRSAVEGRVKRRRPNGTGSLFKHRGKWYGQWRMNGRRVKRCLGPKGLTRSEAELMLAELIERWKRAPESPAPQSWVLLYLDQGERTHHGYWPAAPNDGSTVER